jgi:hypothetical protein
MEDVAPSHPFFVTLSLPFFSHPERSERSLGACAPREDKVEGDAVPNEVRDASLSLGRTR